MFGWNRGIEPEIDEAEIDLGAAVRVLLAIADDGAGGSAPPCVPVGAPAFVRTVPERVERIVLKLFLRPQIVVDDFFDRVDFVRIRMRAFGHDGIFVNAVRKRDHLGQFLEQIHGGRAAEAERHGAVFKRFLQGGRDFPIEEEQDLDGVAVERSGRSGFGPPAEVGEEKLFAVGEELGQHPVAGKGLPRVREKRLVGFESNGPNPLVGARRAVGVADGRHRAHLRVRIANDRAGYVVEEVLVEGRSGGGVAGKE